MRLHCATNAVDAKNNHLPRKPENKRMDDMNNRKKIVVLDGYTVNPGDISWESVERLGNFTLYDRTKPEDTVRRAKDADIVLTNKVRMSAAVMEQLPKLKYVGLLSTGTDIIDINYCDEHGIVVCNIPAYSTGNVAQTVFAMILSICSPVEKYNIAVHEGRWVSSDDFCFQDYPMSDMAGKTLGIIGYGKIGRKVADIARAFDMNVVIYSRTKRDDIPKTEWRKTVYDVAKEADFLTIHCPLTDDTRGIVDKKFLRRMKKSAYLINTSRGGVLNESDVADALNKGLIAGACVDVLSTEPPKADNPMLTAKNCLITPHIAWAGREARERLMDICAGNLEGFLSGRTRNEVGKVKIGD